MGMPCHGAYVYSVAAWLEGLWLRPCILRGHVVRLVDAESILDVSSEIEVIQSQINASNLVDYVSDVDVVINCLPGRIGHSIRENLVSINGREWPIWHSLPKTHKH